MRQPAGDEGSTALELALLAPALALLATTGVQLALYAHAQHVALAAARQGSRAAAVEDGSPAAGQARARDYVQTLGPTILRQVTIRVSGSAASVQVDVHGQAVSLLPGLRLPVHETAQRPREAWVNRP